MICARTIVIAAVLGSSPALHSRDYYEEAPLHYSETAPRDAVVKLQADYASGVRKFEVSRNGPTTKEHLAALLRDLGVSPESQLLVFSKTSLQSGLISPSNPRAIYFSDDCYVGWVPGGTVEIVCYGPEIGPAFYTAEISQETAKPVFSRDNECLSCHTRTSVPGTPGVMVRSVFPRADGHAMLSKGTFQTTYQSPISERWGGWYVTGEHGSLRHMGNQTLSAAGILDRQVGANLTTLESLINTKRYPRRTSDIVAFLVLEHQITVHNTLTEGTFRVRRAKHLQDIVADALGEPRATKLERTALSVANSAATKIVETLLFHGEAEFPENGIAGSGAFEAAFRKKRQPDSNGRALRDFQLLDRTFKNRCSYMIYSGAFQELPPDLKDIVWQQLYHALTHTSEKFAYLGTSERKRILTILKETIPDLPDHWHDA